MINRDFVDYHVNEIKTIYNESAKFDIAIIVCTYNPEPEKLERTLKSCINQKGVSVQIVITDDGSQNNLFMEADEFFSEHGFRDYLLIGAEKNEGTVKNYLKGLQACDAHYVKGISPGDFLYGNTVLCEWIAFLEENRKQWSFGDAVFYDRMENDLPHCIRRRNNPQFLAPYYKKDDDLCRMAYVAWLDFALGASLISTRNLSLKYMEIIKDRVKYAEDNIWRLMMFDGIVGLYYPQPVIYYEYGTGISTNGNPDWAQRIRADCKAADQIMFDQADQADRVQKKILKALRLAYSGKMKKLIYMPEKIDYFESILKKRWFPKMTRVK